MADGAQTDVGLRHLDSTIKALKEFKFDKTAGNAEVINEADVPAGVFNLVNGYGIIVGEAMSAHPGIDMISFTGSTRGGIAVAKAAANTVKRVSQELGGKSANLILEDADFEDAVTRGIRQVMINSVQNCNAPSRMLVPTDRMNKAIEVARKAATNVIPGAPDDGEADIGPGGEPDPVFS